MTLRFRLQDAWIFAVAALVVWRAWPTVPAFTTDSDSYMDVADNLRRGLGLVQRAVDFTRPAIPDPLGMWPPLYPVAVAAAAACGLPVDLAAHAVAAAAYLLFMVGLGRLAGAAMPARYLVPVLALVALRPALIDLSSTAWSEPLFLALLVCGVLAVIDPGATRAGGDGDSRGEDAPRSRVLGSFGRGLVLGAACLTRYVGLPVVAGLIVLVALDLVRARPGLRKVAWAVGALLPPLAWSARNLVVFEAPFGPVLPPSGRSWLEVVGQAASALRWEFVPGLLSAHAATTVAFLGLAAGCGAVAFARGGVSRVIAYLGASYLGWTMLAVHGSAIRGLPGRYMAPVYAFGLLVVADACLAGMRRLPSGAARRMVFAALLVAGVVWAVPRDWGDPGPRRAARQAQIDRAARLAELATLAGTSGGRVLSDVGHLVRTATGRSAVEIPTSFYVGRAFTREDRARWERQGVSEAILARGSPVAPAFADWTPVGMSVSFVRLVPAGVAPGR